MTMVRKPGWEGYTDPSVIEVFTEKTGCTLVLTYVGSNDENTAKMAALTTTGIHLNRAAGLSE